MTGAIIWAIVGLVFLAAGVSWAINRPWTKPKPKVNYSRIEALEIELGIVERPTRNSVYGVLKEVWTAGQHGTFVLSSSGGQTEAEIVEEFRNVSGSQEVTHD